MESPGRRARLAARCISPSGDTEPHERHEREAAEGPADPRVTARLGSQAREDHEAERDPLAEKQSPAAPRAREEAVVDEVRYRGPHGVEDRRGRRVHEACVADDDRWDGLVAGGEAPDDRGT